MKLKEGEAWQAVLFRKIEELLGNKVPGHVTAEKAEVIRKAVKEVLVEEPASSVLPEYVVNGRQWHTSGAEKQWLAHRPRDVRHCFCGWDWKAALDGGLAFVLEKEGLTDFEVCESCVKGVPGRRRRRGLVNPPEQVRFLG